MPKWDTLGWSILFPFTMLPAPILTEYWVTDIQQTMIKLKELFAYNKDYMYPLF